MPKLAEIQQQFLALLLQNSTALEANVLTQGQLSKIQRLDIYRSAYRIRLRGVIDSDHSMLALYLGDELFEALVEGYINTHPSNHPSLRYFADQLPAYLRATLPFRQHPILAEIGAFERCLLNTFDAADGTSLSEKILQQIPPANWPLLKFFFHPSLSVYRCHWNAVESWQALKNGGSPPPAQKSEQAHSWALWRDLEKRTQYSSLSQTELQVLNNMQQAMPFYLVCESLQTQLDSEDIAATLFSFIKQWLQRGWIIGAIPLSTD